MPEKTDVRMYPTQLLTEEAEVVRCFLIKPRAKTPTEIMRELEAAGQKAPEWRQLQNILSALKYHKILDFRDGKRPLVVLNMDFYESVQAMRIRLRVKKVVAEDKVGHELSDFFDQYGSLVKRYILFEPDK